MIETYYNLKFIINPLIKMTISIFNDIIIPKFKKKWNDQVFTLEFLEFGAPNF